MEYLMLFLALALALAGLAGSFLPVVPGPPLSFAALAVLWLSDTYPPDDSKLLAHLAAMLMITALDYFIPILGTRLLGGTPAGTRGAMAGMVVGLFFGIPGILFFPFLGALAGELMVGTPVAKAFVSAIGAFLGFLAGTLLKMAYALVVLVEIVRSDLAG
jgi:uncharacterized protein YqgC (DUF456 family)